jgi:lysozyme
MDFNPNTRLEQNADKFELPVSRFSRLYRTYITPSGDTLRGLDLSHWNADENIDFPTLKANGIDFVILKVTEHTSFVDDTFKSKAEAALAAGLIVMPYHFFRGNYAGAAQAEHCINTLRALGFLDAIEYTTIIWADVESSDGVSQSTRRNRLLAFLQTVEGKGFQGGVYSSPYYWNSLIGNVSWIKDYWQWVAHWSNVSYPTLPYGWTQEKTIVWQNGIHPAHSWVETVIGASGNVDHNYFFGTLERLKEILKFPTTPPPSGDCSCPDEIAHIMDELDAHYGYIEELTTGSEQLWNMIKAVETEVNFLKIEIYNLQQSQTELQNSVNKLESGQNQLYETTVNLDERLHDLEALQDEFRQLLCK